MTSLAVITGPAGRADQIPNRGITAERAAKAPESGACLGCFLFTAHPPQHPFWNQYLINVVHLRDIPGQRTTPVKKCPKDTHNLMVLALNPGEPFNPTVYSKDNWEEWISEEASYLHPINYSKFFHELSDDQAVMLLTEFTRAVVIGMIPAERDLGDATYAIRTLLMQVTKEA